MLVLMTKRRLRQREDTVFSEAYHLNEEEVDETIAEKDAFISKQEAIVVRLIDLISKECPKLLESMDTDLYEQLRDYA